MSNLTSITTHSGLAFPFLAARSEHIVLSDIAHALSMLCRFGGHCARFYSVAEHSVLVARRCPPQHRLWGLLHDAAEAYMGDIPKPIKAVLPDVQQIEKRLLELVAARFGLIPGIPRSVIAADAAMLDYEMNILMAPHCDLTAASNEPSDTALYCLPPEHARELFLREFKLISLSNMRDQVDKLQPSVTTRSNRGRMT